MHVYLYVDVYVLRRLCTSAARGQKIPQVGSTAARGKRILATGDMPSMPPTGNTCKTYMFWAACMQHM